MSGQCVWSGPSRRVALLSAVALLVCAQAMVAQVAPAPVVPAADAPVKLREYEVVSIKENKSDDGMVSMRNTPDGFRTVDMDLKNLISNAYGVRYDLISGGPGWVGSKGFDVEAKVAGPDVEAYKKLDEKDQLVLMQALLKERFNLKVHVETKELPVYDLVVLKGGVKMQSAPPDPPQSGTPEDAKPEGKPGAPARHNGMMHMSMGALSGTGLPMQQISNQLSYIVHHPVNNKTGLDGKYDLELKWADDHAARQDNGSTDTAPSIFTAVQEQLGLKLQPTRGPVETLVIDHVELPSEN